ncbi:hypothetical protein HDU82_007376, partial [Entophlyctis luteolus]
MPSTASPAPCPCQTDLLPSPHACPHACPQSPATSPALSLSQAAWPAWSLQLQDGPITNQDHLQPHIDQQHHDHDALQQMPQIQIAHLDNARDILLQSNDLLPPAASAFLTQLANISDF